MAKPHGLPFLWVIHLFICLFIYSFTQRDPHKPKICLRCIIVKKKKKSKIKNAICVLVCFPMFTGGVGCLRWPAVCWISFRFSSKLNYKVVSLGTFSKPQIKLVLHTLKQPCKRVQSNPNTVKLLSLEAWLHADALDVNVPMLSHMEPFCSLCEYPKDILCV